MPVKLYFEQAGLTVKGEVEDCDIVAMNDTGDIIVVELKTSVNLTVILQALDRKAMTDAVYIAVPAPKNQRRARWKEIVRLCRYLSLGLMIVSRRLGQLDAEVICHPQAFQPRKNKRRTDALIKEFERRQNDLNIGGTTGQKRVTAYREDALRIANYLRERGPTQLKTISTEMEATTERSKTASILQNNYYDWFSRVSRGVYQLTDEGLRALSTYKDVVQLLRELDTPSEE